MGHVVSAVACALTIIGIPLALGHLKLANVALFPVGKAIVDKHVAEEARRQAAQRRLDGSQGHDTDGHG